MTKSWIDVNVDKIVLDQVYMNGLHVLRRLEIQNLCNHPVLVKLRSSLGNQINFQLQNENLPLLNLITSPSVASVGDMDDDLQLQYSTLQKEQFLDESQYNQLFNYVNYVDQVLIPPNQSQSIVLLFLPEKTFESEDDYNNCFDIDGLVFFFAYKADAVVESIDEGNTPPDYQHSVKFRSRVCRSYMWTDIDSAGIIFDDCVVGQTYFRDFTIWNRSEIDLHWVLNEADLLSRKWLEFSDYDSGGPLDFAPIPAYSPKRIRITFKPKEPGDFVYDILIENENDASNTIETRLHASVRSFLREEMLIINTGNFLDFSDCYSGMWKKKEIVLRNVSDAPLEIKFSCDDPNVVFQLRTDDTQTQTSQRSKRTLRSTEHINLFQSDPDLSLQDPSVQSHISRTVSDLSLSYESLSSVDSSHQREIESQAESSQVDLYIDRTEHGNEEIARIDEILMRPGRERHVEVCYRPQREQATQDFRGGKLVKRMFKVSIQYCHPRSKHALEYYNVQCVARVCTTFIEVSPSTLNFGDTDVGTQKTSSIFIKNCSELSAKVELQYVSKVLNTTRGEIVIPPRQTIEAKVEIYPRKVNPNYRKQITVANLFNRDNDCVVEIISTNVDKQHITFHSLYYHIVTSSATNFLDFGSVVLNAPVLRTFTIENISKELVMSISSSLPEDIQIYVKAPSTEPPEIPTTMERREKLLESIDRRKSKWNPSDSPLSNASTNSLGNVKQETEKELAQYLDLASSGRSSPVRRQFGPMDVRSQFIRDKRRSQRAIGSQTELSREPSEMEGMDDMDLLKIKLDSLIQLLEKDNGTVPVFTKASSEERYVKRQQFLFRELSNYIRTQALIPISEITIPQNKSVQIILIMKPSIEKNPYIQSKPRKTDAKIFLKMIQFDQSLHQDSNFDIPVRELMVRCSLVKSQMDLGQRNINFGMMEKSERRTKRMIIRNNSEAPLLYLIRKSGSVASGDLLLTHGRFGVVRGYAKKEVEFVFEPSLPGPFMEKFVIENIQDPENSQTVTVKANIRQPANFVIANLSLDFGPCLVNQSNFNVQEIVISNPSQKHTRWFEVKVDPTDLVFEKCTGEVLFTLSNISEDTKKKMITQEAEDKIEQLHQKLKIAKTKGKLDKISKIQSEIDQLEQGSIETRQRSKTVGPRFKTTEHSIIFPIGPRTLETVKIHFRPKSSDKSHLQYEVCTMQLCVHEHKNIDVMKYVSLSAFVYYDQAQYDSVLKSFIRDTVDSDIFQDQPFSQAEESLTVEVSMVDLGRLEIGESKDCYLTLINKSSEEKSFVIQASKSNAYETQFQSNGIVKPNESLKFDLLLKPLMKGLQTCTLTVTESMKTNQVRFVFYGVHGQYFGFYKSMDLKEKLSDLDLGYCYVEPAKTFAMIRPIVIQNVTNDVIYCSAVSNLTQQCFIFVDHKLETQVNDILLHPHQPLVFYLGLQPNVSNKETKSGRELIGGIKFMASIKDPLVLNTTGLTKTVPLGSGLMPVHTHTLRFKAIIGQSIFSTSLQTIDFGTVSEMKDLHSGFWIQNQTSAMPMELQLRASGTCLKLGLKSIKTEDEKVHVPISFELKQFGYFEESIEILNLNNASNIINVNVRVFVDPQCLSVQVNGSHSRQHLTFSRVYVSQELEPVEDQEQVLLHVESKEEISLCLYSDLSLDISHSTDAVVDTQSVETQTVGAERELTLGNKQFHLMKQLRVKSTDLLVKLLPHKLLMDPTTTEKIQQGDCVSLCGSLMLYSQKVLKMLHVDLTCCLSKSTILNPVIDLGKVGYSNDWLKIPFSINGQNDADFGLCFQAETLDCIQIQSELECKTRSKFSFQCLFDPLHVERDAGPKSIQFRLLNTKSQETHLIQVKFIMTEMELKFERLQEDCLMLPTITIPDKNPQDNYFMITNTSDQDSKFEMQLEEVNPLVTVELVSRLWTSFSGGMVLLAPEAQTEIRVRVTPKPESRLLQEHVHLLEKCLVGYLNVYKSQKSIYRIGLKTLLIEGKTFQISPKTIEFQSMGSQDLLLTNLTMIPIRFKVSVEYPIELQNREILVVSPLNEDGVNILEDQFNLKIDLTNPSTDISETIKLNILDLDSIQKQPQTLNVLMKPKIQEIEKPVQMIELKGCKKILDLLDDQFYGLYELDLGQLDVSMTPHLKKIQLESKVGYDIKIVSHEQWLSCQRQESDKTSMILLTCSLLIRGSFSAYLIIKNLDMIDIKIIRIMLDVVAKPNARMLPPPVDSETLYQNVFDVYCTYDQPLLDMGDVCYGTDYVARSLVIYNRESVALQFSVKSNVQDSSEISFSLSRTAPRLFKTVQIPGQSFQKVYVRYWPGVSKTTEVQESQIHVDCRLVKDYRQTIQFKAICHPPQIQVSRTDFLFKANVTTTVGLEAESDTFTISNCFDEELVFEIASISTFFAIKQITSTDCLPVLPLLDKDSIQRSVFQSCSGHLLIPPKSSLQFKIVPIMDKLNENVEMIRKERYFMKHFVIYNRKRPFEKHFIYIRLGFGHLDHFQLAYGSVQCFQILESSIVRLLQHLASHPPV